jgi:hypothetical protein
LDKVDPDRLLGDGFKHLKHPAHGTQAVRGGKQEFGFSHCLDVPPLKLEIATAHYKIMVFPAAD